MKTNIRLTFLFMVLFIGFYANAQDNGTQWGKQEALAKQKFHLYMEFFQFTKNMTKAYPRWHWLFNFAPRSDKRIYVDGPRVVKHEISIELQQSRRILLEDTLFMIYDNRIKYFGDEGIWLGKKAVEMFDLRLNDKYFKEIYATAKKSVELQGKYSYHDVLPVFFKMSFIQYRRKAISHDELISAISKLNEIASFKINGATSHKKEYLFARNDAFNTATKKRIFKSCKNVHDAFYNTFISYPEDIILIDKYYEALQEQDCLEDSVFLRVALNKYEREATAELAAEIAETYDFFEEKEKAIEYYMKAFEMEEAKNLKVIYAFETAKLHKDLKQYESSRDYVFKSLSLNNKFAKGYILLGNVYRKATPDCDTGSLGESALNMLSIQMYQKAKELEPSLNKKLDARIDNITKLLPTANDLPKDEEGLPLFKAGDSYRVGCWIDEEIKIMVKEVEEIGNTEGGQE